MSNKGGFFANFFAKSDEGKKVRKISVPILVIITAVILIVISPWQGQMQDKDTPPDDNVSTPDLTQAPDGEDVVKGELINIPTPIPEVIEPDYDTGIYNPLTGRPVFEDISANRPWAVAIGNYPVSQPLWGISRADMIIEYLVEGSTRFMAMYQDVSTVGTIRGLRSFRTSSMEIAAGFDAIHAHWGGRTYENEEVYGSPVTKWGTIDGEWDKIGFRVSTSVLNIALEHRGAVTGERLVNNVPESFPTEHKEGYIHPFTFIEDGTPAGGESAKKAEIKYPFNVKISRFTYDENEKAYYMEQWNRKLTDGIDGKTLSFTNVLVLQMSTSSIKVNDSTNHMKITNNGEGTGYFMCGGKYIDIKWSRPSLTDQFKFTHTDGTPLEFGVGKTFICIVGKNDTQTFE